MTDEDAFRVIEKQRVGISVFVGKDKTATSARYHLQSPSEVADFLARLMEVERKT